MARVFLRIARKPPSSRRRRVGFVLKIIGAALLITAVTGSIYEQIRQRRDRHRLPQVGRSIDIGGRTLNIFCSGEGRPAVILDSGASEPGFAWSAAQVARRVGLIRLMTPGVALPDEPAQRTREQIVQALRQQPKTIATLADPTTPESYAQAEAAGGLGDRPLIVLTQGRLRIPPNPTDVDRQRLSTRGRQIIVEKSGHRIPEEAPEEVINAVREVLAEVRRGA